MRRQARASSARSKARKPVGSESASSSGRLRFAILAATVAAFLLVPVAQAAAETLTVNGAGSGSGEVSSVGGIGAYGGEFEGYGSLWQGEPPIECSYASPGPATGACEAEVPEEEGIEGIALRAIPAPGSVFAGWTLTNAANAEPSPEIACGSTPNCFAITSGGGAGSSVKAAFCLEGQSEEECLGPKLTVTKEGAGLGTVVSNPAGIECGLNCSAPFAKNTKVTLTASPESGSKFLSWKGCETGGAIGHTCKVTMDKAKTVVAKFGPVSSLTLTKAGTGTGTVKSLPSGISCDGSCSSNVAAFTEGATVTLTATPTKYHTFTGWSGACSGTGTCEVTMSAGKSVTATFASTKYALTLKKAGGGTGAVKSKPASLTCGATCSSVVSSFYAGIEVEVTATPSKGSALNWSTGSGTCTGSTSPCFVTMSEAKELVAEFK